MNVREHLGTTTQKNMCAYMRHVSRLKPSLSAKLTANLSAMSKQMHFTTTKEGKLRMDTPDPRAVDESPEPYLGKSVYRQSTFAYRPGIHKERKVRARPRLSIEEPPSRGTKASPHDLDGRGKGLGQISSDSDKASALYFMQVEDQEDEIDEELVCRRKIATTPYLGAQRELEFQILAFEALEFRRNFLA